MKTIILEELLEHFGFVDVRAVKAWCEKNDVLVVKQGKIEFVYEMDFQMVYELPFINKLKKKFGDEWERVYRLYKDGNVPALVNINDLSKNSLPIYNNKSKKDSFYYEILKKHEEQKKVA